MVELETQVRELQDELQVKGASSEDVSELSWRSDALL